MCFSCLTTLLSSYLSWPTLQGFLFNLTRFPLFLLILSLIRYVTCRLRPVKNFPGKFWHSTNPVQNNLSSHNSQASTGSKYGLILSFIILIATPRFRDQNEFYLETKKLWQSCIQTYNWKGFAQHSSYVSTVSAFYHMYQSGFSFSC